MNTKERMDAYLKWLVVTKQVRYVNPDEQLALIRRTGGTPSQTVVQRALVWRKMTLTQQVEYIRRIYAQYS